MKMLKLLQLICVQAVLSASSYDNEDEDSDTQFCANGLPSYRDCKPEICSFNYPVIRNVDWSNITCCGKCTPQQCCKPEKWWLTVPIALTYVLIILGYLYITRPSSSFFETWIANSKRSANILSNVNEAEKKTTDGILQGLWFFWCYGIFISHFVISFSKRNKTHSTVTLEILHVFTDRSEPWVKEFVGYL